MVSVQRPHSPNTILVLYSIPMSIFKIFTVFSAVFLYTSSSKRPSHFDHDLPPPLIFSSPNRNYSGSPHQTLHYITTHYIQHTQTRKIAYLLAISLAVLLMPPLGNLIVSLFTVISALSYLYHLYSLFMFIREKRHLWKTKITRL